MNQTLTFFFLTNLNIFVTYAFCLVVIEQPLVEGITLSL